ncbi:MAG: pentapeptide repeat-containing protein [Cyanobacteria bacterium P01_H01_bin.152]
MAGASAIVVAAAIVFAVAFEVVFVGVVPISVAIALAAAVAVAKALVSARTEPIAVTVAVVLVAASFIVSLYLSHRIRNGDPKFETLHSIGLAFVVLGGTTFSGTDLTGASFAHTQLKSTYFADSHQRPTVLNRIRWYQAQQLDWARLGTSNLQDPRVRNLLVTLNGADQDLTNADLREVNLAGATLHRINFNGANLNGAILAGAELHGASLTNVQCVGTDFTRAYLTGACLEAWNIDETTILKDIDCDYVFLKAEADARGNRERRPHNPDKVFQPGDFEKYFKEMLDTVQLLIRNGVNPQAFQAAFEQVMADNPEITRESIQAMEKQGDDVMLTLQVPEGTDKAQVERSWDQGYPLGLEAGYTKGLLQGQTQRAEDVKEVALGFSNLLSSIQITNMNNPINSGDGGFINTGRMEGNVVNLGELSGQVTVQINQLPDAAPSSDQRSLKDLLTELQTSIEAETELSDIEKKEALGEVGRLAEAGAKPQENAMQRMAKRAAANLKSITEPLSEASNLVTVCKSLLPMIMVLF